MVSFPTLVARMVKEPDLFIDADRTRSPGDFSTGRDSPVKADSSTAENPSVNTPSTGMDRPGRTRIKSPTATSSTGISTSCPSRSTEAVFGARSIKRAMACPVLPLERVSRNLPNVIKVKIMPADSKYRSMDQRSTLARASAASPTPCASAPKPEEI